MAKSRKSKNPQKASQQEEKPPSDDHASFDHPNVNHVSQDEFRQIMSDLDIASDLPNVSVEPIEDVWASFEEDGRIPWTSMPSEPTWQESYDASLKNRQIPSGRTLPTTIDTASQPSVIKEPASTISITARQSWSPSLGGRILVEQYVTTINSGDVDQTTLASEQELPVQVEKITALALETTKKGTAMPRVNVKWIGCPMSENTWEPIYNIENDEMLPSGHTRQSLADAVAAVAEEMDLDFDRGKLNFVASETGQNQTSEKRKRAPVSGSRSLSQGQSGSKRARK